MSMDNPRYQRLQQRMAALRPDQQAILSVAQDGLTGKMADEDARRDLQGQRTAMQEQGRARDLGMRRDSLALNQELGQGRLDLAQDSFKDQKSDARKGEMLGLANLGISGGLGYLDMQRAQDEEARVAALARRYLNAGGNF